MRRWIDRIQSAALLVLGAVSFVYFGPLIDKGFPVIDPFVIANKEISGDTVTISGWLHKRRECEFLEASGRVERDTGLPLSIPFEFVDVERPYTRPMGAQEWGPWRMVVPADAKRVQVLALHNCHPLWKTRTELAVIEVSK